MSNKLVRMKLEHVKVWKFLTELELLKTHYLPSSNTQLFVFFVIIAYLTDYNYTKFEGKPCFKKVMLLVYSCTAN